MRVDRDKALRRQLDGETFYFCSERCMHSYERGEQEQGRAPTRAP